MTTEKVSAGVDRIITTACASHCGGACVLKVHTRDGVITRIETDDGEEPQLRACLRCRAYRQRVYDPERLKYPMRRTGERGEGKFERISWSEALDQIAGEISRIRSAYGPSSISCVFSGADHAHLHVASNIASILGMTGGYTAQWGVHSFEGGLFASLATYGTLASRNGPEDLVNSRLIILWGMDPAVSIHETNFSWYLAQAKEAGARIISVDPRFTSSTAVFADQWIPIIPGTDAAMLVSMSYVIIKKGLHHQDFLDTYTFGFAQFRDYVLGKEDGIPKTPEWAANITGVSAGVIEKLAVEYATTKPAALIGGIAPGRTAYGEQYHRLIKVLAAMTANIGKHGGWAGRSFIPRTLFGAFDFKLAGLPRGANPVENGAPPRPDALPTAKGSDSSARIHLSQFADAILRGKQGGHPADIKMLFVMHLNYLNQEPNTNKIIRALKKLEFIAVAEQFMTATARFADILLPVSTFLERNDIVAQGAIPWYGFMNKVIEPLYESKSPLEICQELATRLGVTSFSEKTEEEWLRHMVKGSHIPDYEDFKKKAKHMVNSSEPTVAFKKQIEDPQNNPFPTPSGKIEIYSQKLAAADNPLLPPIPKYIGAWEGRNDPLAKKYPLQLITSHCKRRAHSQFERVPWLRELVPQAITMSTTDAAARGVKNGDMVRVFNDRGEVIVPAIVTERILPGVVELPQGAWFAPDELGRDRGGCTNVLSKDAHSPGGAFPYNTCLVQIQKFK